MNDLVKGLATLGLRHTSGHLDDVIALATKRRWSPTQLLEHLVESEQQERTRRSLERRLLRSAGPIVRRGRWRHASQRRPFERDPPPRSLSLPARPRRRPRGRGAGPGARPGGSPRPRERVQVTDGHPPEAIAFLRRVRATPAAIADDALLEADVVVHVASQTAGPVAEFCAEATRLLGAASEPLVLGGVVRPMLYTGNAMHNFAYAHRVLQQPGPVMPSHPAQASGRRRRTST